MAERNKQNIDVEPQGNSRWAMTLAQARGRLRGLDAEKAEVVQAMENLVQRYARTFTPPWPARPMLQRLAQGRVYLRWRRPGRYGNQPYVNLAGESGRPLMLTLPVEVRQVFLWFSREAMALNLAHSLRQAEWLRLRQFIADSEALLAVAREAKSGMR